MTKYKLSFVLLLAFLPFISFSQCWQLVWEDDFSGSSLDLNKWSYQTGTGTGGWGNNELQYYRDGSNNLEVSGGTLRIIAREESFGGQNYTSARIHSINKGDWTYGKMEASIKLPAGQGIWPAFWMLPTESVYGYWPQSGEIDIMELLGHQNHVTHGTCHYGVNSPYDHQFSGSSYTLSSGTFSDAFHTFTVEWTPSEIRWYLDGIQFFSIDSSNPAFSTYNWPFDQNFHYLLNVAVGGNWPGAPDNTTVFPATMEVDWVRTYQNTADFIIVGDDTVEPGATGTQYSVPNASGLTYNWTVPSGASITAGQGTHQITLDWGTASSNDITVSVGASCGTENISKPVLVTANQLENYAFEEDFQNWTTISNGGAVATFNIETSNVQEGTKAACTQVSTPGLNNWNVQLRREGINWESGENYTLSFWAKSDPGGLDFNATFIDETFAWYGGQTFNLTDQWAPYSMTITAPQNDEVWLTLDMGDDFGTTCLDNFFFGRTALLPVELNTFQAERTEKSSVLLSWQTNMEENLSHFEVERSTDLSTWETASKKDARNIPGNYQTEDFAAPFEQVFYRLKSIDTDGSLQISKTVSVAEVSDPVIRLFPNPVAEGFTLTGENLDYAEIINTQGQVVKKLTFTPESSKYISCTELPKGLYRVRAQSLGQAVYLSFVKL